MSELATEIMGHGDRVVLVHGSLATGVEEWAAQQPLADDGFRLVFPDRRGYGNSPDAEGEDFMRDGEDLADLLEAGGHVVAHSYGCLGAMFAAAKHPASTWSLTLLEPPAFTLTGDAAANQLVSRVRDTWNADVADDEWLERFLESVGTDPEVIPREARAELVAMVPLVRNSRPPWETEPPFEALAAAPFPKLVVSGGHNDGFEAICDDLADRMGGERAVVEGAGHEIQFTGPPINQVLLDLWRTTD